MRNSAVRRRRYANRGLNASSAGIGMSPKIGNTNALLPSFTRLVIGLPKPQRQLENKAWGSLKLDMPATSTLVSTTARELRIQVFGGTGDLRSAPFPTLL